MNESLSDILKRVAEDTLKGRMKTWIRYEFENNMLPRLLDEVTSNVRVELITNANIPEEIRIKIRYEKTEL